MVAHLADRIAVLFGGRLMGIVPGDSSRELLGLMMAGLPVQEAREQIDQQGTKNQGTNKQGTTNGEGMEP